MIIKNKKQFKEYKEVCDISVEILLKIKDFLKTGLKTIEVDNYADDLCKEYNVKAAFKGVVVGSAPPYEKTICISINDTVVHGIPSYEIIKEGDIVKIDFGIVKNGYYTDHCFTVGMKEIETEKKIFIQESKNAVLLGVQQAIEDNYIGDIGYAIEQYARNFNYSTVREFVGHSIGKSLHEYPDVPAYGKPRDGVKLSKGLVLCIEAQIINGQAKTYILDDNWTVKTQDGSDACMFEYIVMVDKKKPRILTNTIDWSIVK